MSYLSEDHFEKHLDIIDRSSYIAVDTEGTLTHPHSITWGLSYSADGYSEYFAFNHGVGENLPRYWLPKLIDSIKKRDFLVFHNAKHDLQALRNLGLNYTGQFYDTMLMVHMINENLPSKSLDYVSKHYGGDPKRNEEIMKRIIAVFGWEFVPVDLIRPYGANDAYITDELFRKLLPEFREQGFDGQLWRWDEAFCRSLIKLENPGILIDQDLSQRELERGLKIMKALEKGLGFNPASTKQLGKFLLEDLGLPVIGDLTDKGNPSFKKENMEVYDQMLSRKNDKRAQQVLAYRGWQKTTSSNYKSYLEKLGPDGKLRCNYKQHGTKNGRLSCEDPNLQQIPRASKKDWNGKLKAAFIHEKGRVRIEFDYSQLEFRVGAAYGQEKKLIEVFNDPERDIFNEMALALRMIRDDTKTLSYTIQFGGGADRVSRVFDMSHTEAKARINNYYKTYPGLAKITALAQQRAKENGHVSLWTGRRRHLYGEETRKAFSSLCQGGGFEIVKRSNVELDRQGINNGDECIIDLQVHDSMVANIEEGKEHIYIPAIIDVMENTIKDHFPFGVDFRVKHKPWGA